MSDTYPADISVTSTWTDLAATYTAMAGTQSWVQNKGPGDLLVAYSSSATAPAGGGAHMHPGTMFGGSAAHCWVKSVGNGGCIASVGLI